MPRISALTHDAPGLSGPPDDDFSDVRWQDSVEKVADEIARVGETGDLVAVLADYAVAAAIRKAIVGHPLNYSDRDALTNLHSVCDTTSKAVAAEYERREEA